MNISPIANGLNFNGKVFWSGSTKTISNTNEKNAINRYAKINDCDVVILNYDYYITNKGMYNAIIVKEDDVTGLNRLYTKTFDFQNPTDGDEKEFFISQNGDIRN